MKYTHRNGEDAAAKITIPDVGSVPVEEGVFECDPPEEVHDRLVALGHTPLEEGEPPDSNDDVDESDGDEDEEEELPLASDYTEDEIVNGLSYGEKQAIAGQYDHIAGNASDEKLTEELIKQRREETDDGA